MEIAFLNESLGCVQREAVNLKMSVPVFCCVFLNLYLSLAYSVLFSYPNLSLTESSANNSMFISALNDLHIIAPFSDIRL